MLSRIFKDPLLHFLALGAGLFWLYYEVADPQPESPNEIVISGPDIELLRSQWQKQWRRPPTERELQGMIDSQVREIVLYREAIALGLDQDDIIIRRRLGQKLEFMFKDLAEQTEPEEKELAEFLERNPDRYIIPGGYTFDHIYFNRDKRGASTKQEATELLKQLNASDDAASASEQGDRFLYPYHFEDQNPGQIARVFGRRFAETLSGLEPGRWLGPIESGYGLHLVKISQRTEPRQPSLQEVRDKVMWDLIAQRSKEVDKAFYEEMRGRYNITIEAKNQLEHNQ